MLKTTAIGAEEPDFILSSTPASRGQRRLAIALVLGLLAVYLITVGPLAEVPPYPLVAFVPAYAVAMLVIDSITAILLFAEFSILGERSILIIANGYLFTALILIPWMLTFPGVFATGSLIGGPQSTVWLYFAWHAGFVLFVIGYALSKDSGAGEQYRHDAVHWTIAGSVAMTVVAVLIVAALCTLGEASLPRIMLDSARFGPLWPLLGVPVPLLCIAALILLWLRQR